MIKLVDINYQLPVKEFVQRTGIDMAVTYGGKNIVSLKSLNNIENCKTMSIDYLNKMLLSVTISSGIKIYSKCEIRIEYVQPRNLRVCHSIDETEVALIPTLLKKIGCFDIDDICHKEALILWGYTNNDKHLQIAHYVLPVIERHADCDILIRGHQHAFLLAKNGKDMRAIVIYGVNTPIPYKLKSWVEATDVLNGCGRRSTSDRLLPSRLRRNYRKRKYWREFALSGII